MNLKTIIAIVIISINLGSLFGCSKSIGLLRKEVDEGFNHPDVVSSETKTDVEPEKKFKYKNNSSVTREDFIDKTQDEGSLWASNGQTNYYFTKNRVRNSGDIVALVIENDLYRDIGVEVRESLSPKEKASELSQMKVKFQQRYGSSRGGLHKDATPQATAQNGQPNPAPSLVPELPMPKDDAEFEKNLSELNLSNVDIYSSLHFKSGDKMMGEIIERYPNGNYKVKTSKRVAYEHGAPRIVNVTGVIKSSDIDEDTDTISSGKLYEYRVEVSH